MDAFLPALILILSGIFVIYVGVRYNRSVDPVEKDLAWTLIIIGIVMMIFGIIILFYPIIYTPVSVQYVNNPCGGEEQVMVTEKRLVAGGGTIVTPVII